MAVPDTAASAVPEAIRCGQAFTKSVFPIAFTGGYGVAFAAALRCSSPVALGVQSRLETPNHSPQATSKYEDCAACKTLAAGGGYFESLRKSHRVFTSCAYLAPPKYHWVRRNTPGQGGSCHGYETNFLLCARYSKVFR